jgi:hypothetical protein
VLRSLAVGLGALRAAMACSGEDAQWADTRAPQTEAPEATVEADGSVYVPAIGGGKPFTLSAPLIPCSPDLVRHAARAMKSKEGTVELARRVGLPFSFWLEQCAEKYDFLQPPAPGQRLPPDVTLRNYIGVDLCLVETYHARGRWMPHLFELVDVCHEALGEAWRMPSTKDTKDITQAQRAYLRSAVGLQGLRLFDEVWKMFTRDELSMWVPIAGPFYRVAPGAASRSLHEHPSQKDTNINYENVVLRCIHWGTERTLEPPAHDRSKAVRCLSEMKRHTANVDQPALNGIDEVTLDEVRGFAIWVELVIASPKLFTTEEASRRARQLQALPSDRWSPEADYSNRLGLILASRRLLDDADWSMWTNAETPALRAALEELAHGRQPPQTAPNARALEGSPMLPPRREPPYDGPIPQAAPRRR